MVKTMETVSARDALERLRRGNEAFVEASANDGDISAELVADLYEHGQAPYACIVTCSDSRVVPEHAFMTGLGELFTIRVAGNVIGAIELASCVYAAGHLGTKLVVVLGHTACGAVGSALELVESGAGHADAADVADADVADADADSGDADADAQGHGQGHGHGNALDPLLDLIVAAVGDERDPREASILNTRASVARLLSDPEIAALVENEGLLVCGALYDTATGKVDFLG